MKNNADHWLSEFARRSDDLPELPPRPFSLSAVGTFSAPAGWREYASGNTLDFCSFFWGASGSAHFRINHRDYQLHAGEALCRLPGESHLIEVNSDHFRYHWFTVVGGYALPIVLAYNFPRDPFHAGAPPRTEFKLALDNLRSFSRSARFDDTVMAVRLLNTLAQRLGAARRDTAVSLPQLVAHFRAIVDARFSDPDLKLEDIAIQLQCHRVTLTRLVHRFLGVSPSGYLNNLRMQHAIFLLTHTRLTAAEIGGQCGLGTAEYFSRSFKKYTGCPPRRFRERGEGTPPQDSAAVFSNKFV